MVQGARTGPASSPPAKSSLPTLAPPRRADAQAPVKPEPGVVDAGDIDIDLEAGLDEPTADKPRRAIVDGHVTTQQLSAICTFGRYEVLGRIAFGGMAEIFLGRETTQVGASRYLVIKRILPHVADDDQFVQMFLDEARLAIQLNHPAICHIYEFGELDGSYFIAMEWINGVPLGKLLRKARLVGGVPPEIAVRVIAQVAEALHYAHRAKDALGRPLGIVHRDVSPHNVMVAYDGQVKLLDFGIAKASSHTTKTEAGVVKGKFSYMAPEQCLGKSIDARADIFALGICLWEALTGEGLYHKENEYETMRAVIHDDAPRLATVRKDLPEGLDDIVQKALAKKPEDRYQTANDLANALEGWLAQARKIVNAAAIAELMEELYEEQIKRGPLVDSTPFGASFQRRSAELSNPSLSGSRSGLSGTGSAVEALPRRRSPLMLVAATLIAVLGLGAGGWLYLQSTLETQVAAATPAAPPVEPAPEPASTPVPEPAPEPAAAAPAAPEPAIVRGSLRIESAPGSALVSLDGRALGESPVTLADLPVGTHHVVVTRAGWRDWEGDVEVVEGQQARIEAQLVPLARGPVAPPGRLSINTRPWSKVYVGSRLLGTTPIAEANVPSGRVRLRLVDRDGNVHNKVLQVAPNGTERIFYELGQ